MWWIALIAIASPIAVGLTVAAFGPAMRRAPADSLLTERIEQHRLRLTTTVTLVTVLSIVALGMVLTRVGATFNLTLLPLAVVFLLLVNSLASLAGDLPTRRAIFGETWNRREYVCFWLRLVSGLWGYWIIAMIAPCLVALSGPGQWPTAVILFLLFMQWSRNFHRVTPRLIGSDSSVPANLQPLFDDVVKKSNAPSPVVETIGPDKGVLVSAFALPSNQAPRVLLGRPLLRLFTSDEIKAIFAHEVAHLEQFDAKLLRRMTIKETAMAILACFGVPVLDLRLSGASTLLQLAWPFAVLVFQQSSQAATQRRETEGDQRAVELCGDGEALIRALKKMHAANRQPRRMAAEVETRLTHPSLARRIQDIRAVMGDKADEPGSMNSNDRPPADWRRAYPSRDHAGRVVLFEPARIHWLVLPDKRTYAPEDLGEIQPPTADRLVEMAMHATDDPYSQLRELRVALSGNKPALHSMDLHGTKRAFDLRDSDVDAVQGILDRVDIQLAPLNAKPPRRNLDAKDIAARLACALPALLGVLVIRENSEFFDTGSIVWLILSVVPAVLSRGALAMLATTAMGSAVLAYVMTNRADGALLPVGTILALLAVVILYAYMGWRGFRKHTASRKMDTPSPVADQN